MVLSRGYFYKTIAEGETAIKQYYKEHYFIRLLNRPRRIKNWFVGNRHPPPQRIKKIIRRELLPTNKKTFIRPESSRNE